jgi:ATP-dependent RNA helicase DeaD
MTFIEPKEYRQLRLIMKLAHTKIQRRELPTASDILERQKDLVQERLVKTLQQNRYDDYHTIISDVAAEGFDLVDIAAAALKLSLEGFQDEPKRSADGFGDTGGAPGMVRLFLNIGRNQKIRPSDLVRAIADEADIPGDTIGVINIYDRFTFVEVPEDVAERVMNIMHRNTVKGYKVNVEPARKR